MPVAVIAAAPTVPVKVGDALIATLPVPVIEYSPTTPALSYKTRVLVPLVIAVVPMVIPPPAAPQLSVPEPLFVSTPAAFAGQPEIPVVGGRPVAFVSVKLEGVPPAPLNNTIAPAEPVLTANAVATPVPRPETPVLIGRPVALVKVPLAGVPKAGVMNTGEVSVTKVPFVVAPVIPPNAPELLY